MTSLLSLGIFDTSHQTFGDLVGSHRTFVSSLKDEVDEIRLVALVGLYERILEAVVLLSGYFLLRRESPRGCHY